MTEQQLFALEEAITALREKLTGDMFADMEVRDEIHNLEMQLKGVKPLDSHFDCIGCGSYKFPIGQLFYYLQALWGTHPV